MHLVCQDHREPGTHRTEPPPAGGQRVEGSALPCVVEVLDGPAMRKSRRRAIRPRKARFAGSDPLAGPSPAWSTASLGHRLAWGEGRALAPWPCHPGGHLGSEASSGSTKGWEVSCQSESGPRGPDGRQPFPGASRTSNKQSVWSGRGQEPCSNGRPSGVSAVPSVSWAASTQGLCAPSAFTGNEERTVSPAGAGDRRDPGRARGRGVHPPQSSHGREKCE